MKKQTAVEYLIQSINERIDLRTLKYWNEINEFVEKAQAMEKEQMINAFDNGEACWYDDFSDYYTSTYEK